MSVPARVHHESTLGAIILAFNEDRKARVSTNFHYSKTASLSGPPRSPTATVLTVSAAVASNEATAIVLANNIRAVLQAHALDDAGHKVKDSTFAALAAVATSLATAITLANDEKAKYNTHIASTTFHANADATNGIAAADATDEASLITLLNEMRTDITAHIAGGLAGYSIRVVAA